MIEETIQKLTASIEALTAQLTSYNKVALRCVDDLQSLRGTFHTTSVSLPTPPVAEMPKAEMPKKAKKPTLVEAPLDPAPAPTAAPAQAPAPAEPKYPEQVAIIDTAGQLLNLTNQNDGGFLRNLAKELGLDKLRNAKPEQRQVVIDRINAEITRIKEGAV